MRRRTTIFRAGVAVLALAVGLAGCGRGERVDQAGPRVVGNAVPAAGSRPGSADGAGAGARAEEAAGAGAGAGAGTMFGAGTGSVSASAAGPASTASAAAPPTAFYATPFERRPDPATLTALGRRLFSDVSLSASGRMSCASCHDPAHAYGPPDGAATRSGGTDGRRPGLRAVPSLRYQQDTPPFSEHFSDTDGDDSVDQGPTGGRTWDGRAASAHEQAALPLLSPFEMGNADRAAAVARLRRSPNADALRRDFGAGVLDDDRLAWNALLLALEVFQQSPEDFYPYSSRYDAALRGQVRLDAQERRGLALFEDVTRGNCAQCHVSAIKRGAFPQFTDRGLIALGVPRNPTLAANADPAWHDLGLCGPLRTDLPDHPEYCGLFKTPTLRNVASRGVFFHNGAMHRLEDVVRFYAERDVHPARWYGRAGGRPRHYDDLPAVYHANVTHEPPFDRGPGQAPALSAAEIADVVAFLCTLNDADIAAPACTRRRGVGSAAEGTFVRAVPPPIGSR